MYSHALKTWTGSDSYVFAYSVSVTVNQTSCSPGHSPVSICEEMWWHCSSGRSSGGGYIDRCCLSDGTFVPWTTESLYVFLVASEYGRWTALLQADYITSETETEVTWIFPGHLLSGYVYLATVSVKKKKSEYTII